MAVISVGTIHAQADALKETFDDAEYFLQQEEYNEALSGYLKIYKRGFQQNGNINYRIGICYINSTIDKTKAITYLETAVKNISPKYKEGSLKETKAPFDAYLYLANAYRINLDFDKAINAYNQYNELAAQAKREVAANIAYSKIQIKACKRCKEAINRPQRILVTNIGKPINTTAANYNPAFSADGNVIAYMTKQRFYDAVMISHKVKGKWTEPDNITPSIQSDGNQYVCSLSPDGKTLFLSKEDNFNSDIYTSQFDGTTWSVSKPLGKEINTKFWESHASITADGKYLYFSSNRKTLSKGGTDIFVSKMVGGLWQPAENLGGVINTEWNEDAPFISPDGNTLYFSSQGHEGYGGYDIYYSVKVGKDWSSQ
jgi:hypothetical protein